MAIVADIDKQETGTPGIETVRFTVTSTGDYYDSSLGVIRGVFAHDETTQGGVNATFSGQRVTLTATAGDKVNLLVWGNP